MALFIGFGTLYRALVQPWLLRAGENIARFGCAALGGRRWRRSLMHGAAGVGHRRSSGGSPPRARSSPRSYSSSGCCPSTSHPSYSTSSGARTSPTKVGPPAGLQRPRSDTATSSAAYLVVHGEAVVTIHFREVLRCALVGARVPAVPGPSTPPAATPSIAPCCSPSSHCKRSPWSSSPWWAARFPSCSGGTPPAAAARRTPRLRPWARHSILYAYNSFEYKWSMHGLSLSERLRACEDNWCALLAP